VVKLGDFRDHNLSKTQRRSYAGLKGFHSLSDLLGTWRCPPEQGQWGKLGTGKQKLEERVLRTPPSTAYLRWLDKVFSRAGPGV